MNWLRRIFKGHEHEFSKTPTDVYRDKYCIVYFYKCKYCGLNDVKEVKTPAGLNLEKQIADYKSRHGIK